MFCVAFSTFFGTTKVGRTDQAVQLMEDIQFNDVVRLVAWYGRGFVWQ